MRQEPKKIVSNCNLTGLGMTFQQLLSKHGFIQDENSGKPRQRPWHIMSKKQQMELESEDSD
jgi:hypothetical protein